ncbi:hypothetical protein OHT61_32440 (plasmid) [Streptomyces sp. NBC_00178]|uniref:hypothetical protein n=1 Tax=Streptomyces sp. NBC_00178 TaxID=2975672 RepID=UPI002E2B271B|nr:hypothetical protein [Streptomyces sp. NBC_00178]
MVITAIDADMEAGGLDNVHNLTGGAGTAAAGLTFWLAQERNMEPAALLAQLAAPFPQNARERDVVRMLETLLTGPPGMTETADFAANLFHEDEERFYDLIVDLGRYAASCIGMLETSGISSEAETLEALDDMLQQFFAPEPPPPATPRKERGPRT